MKKTSTKIFFTLILSAIAATGFSQNMVTADDGSLVQQSATESGPHFSIEPSAICDSLSTTLAGGNNHRGNMFDISATNAVTITSFDAHPMGNTSYEIYYKVGTYVGDEQNAGAWTLVGSAASVIAQPFGTATPLPIVVNITIPAGQTYGWYVTSSNTGVSQNYTNGTSVGNIYASDANINFMEGCGLEYPFASAPFTPRIWNGNIHYCTGSGIGVLSTTAKNLSAYPNPMTENSTLKFSETIENGTVKIFDILGQEVNVISGINSSEVNISKGNMNPGMYFFSVTDENGYNGNGKITVQ